MSLLPKIEIDHWESDFEADWLDWALPIHVCATPMIRIFQFLCFRLTFFGIEKASENDVEQAIDYVREIVEELDFLHEHLHSMLPLAHGKDGTK